MRRVVRVEGAGPVYVLAALLVACVGCGSANDSGGRAAGAGATPLGAIVAGATEAERAAFERGRAVALRRFTAEEGHGPSFNVDACGACHEKPVLGGSAGRYRNFLLVGRGSGAGFGLTGVNGVQPQFTRAPATRIASDQATSVIATRNPIPFFGVGLLAAVSEDEILRREDPDDRDGDGISGRANREGRRVGRFGRKAQTASLEGFARGPLFNHMGITTNPLPETRRADLPVPSALVLGRPALRLFDWLLPPAWAQVPAGGDRPTTDADGVPDPELGEQDLFDLVAFVMLLAPPEAEPPTAVTAAGRARFEALGCAACHVPELDGPDGPVGAFSDLLLHDMGPALADGIEMGALGTGSEFRTQPLWGVGAVAPYLHDGRAPTLDLAIRLHGGEAAASRDAYVAATAAARAEVLAFLESLGGRAQQTAGLLPPGAPVPAPGAFGAPDRPLADDARARFVRGRALFDRDFAAAEGLGEVFNGDSCRACHFDPAIGGAGPIDVNVMRHGIVDEAGGFTAPAIGTIVHRHTTVPTARAEDASAADANFFEMRQPPPVFGLGLVEEIPEATILAREDPDDRDGDGVRGRAHRLADGRLGRFGWKAQVPTLRDFARDALSSEVGLSVPASATSGFGFATDGDAAADPETSEADVDDLTFFMAALAAPPRVSTDAAAEAVGSALFEGVGCAACHVPALATADGRPVALFSDLLLHDVRPAGEAGIADGDARPREFRTPPLWGLGRTGPYMHDGRTSTIRGAILRHDTEAARARRAFEALDPTEQAQVLAFLASL